MKIHTLVLHELKKELAISANEYILIDTIYHLSNHKKSKVFGWCYASRQALASILDISKTALINMCQKLIKEGFLEKEESKAFLKTTKKWDDAYLRHAKKEEVALRAVKKLNQNAVKKLVQSDEETLFDTDKKLNRLGKETCPTVGQETCHNNNKFIDNYIDNNNLNRESVQKQVFASRTEKKINEEKEEKIKQQIAEKIKLHPYMPVNFEEKVFGRALESKVEEIENDFKALQAHDLEPSYIDIPKNNFNALAVPKNSKLRVFVAPSLNDVYDYMSERTKIKEQTDIDTFLEAEKFINYYMSNGWMVGRTKMKDWRAAAAGWLSRVKQYSSAKTERQKMVDQKNRIAAKVFSDEAKYYDELKNLVKNMF